MSSIMQSRHLPGPEWTLERAEALAEAVRDEGGLAWIREDISRGEFYGYRMTFIPFETLEEHVDGFRDRFGRRKERFLAGMATVLEGGDE